MGGRWEATSLRQRSTSNVISWAAGSQAAGEESDTDWGVIDPAGGAGWCGGGGVAHHRACVHAVTRGDQGGGALLPWRPGSVISVPRGVACLSPLLNVQNPHSWTGRHAWPVRAAAAKSLQSCLTLRPHRWQPTRLPRPWDSPGKNTGVGCHFLLQCMKVKSESEAAQSCLTLSNPMDCSLPGSSVHGIFQARVLEWGAIAFSMANA